MERPRLITALGSLALGAGLGLGLMFLLDPQLGRGRRARLGERLRRGTGAGGRAIAGAGSVAQGSRPSRTRPVARSACWGPKT